MTSLRRAVVFRPARSVAVAGVLLATLALAACSSDSKKAAAPTAGGGSSATSAASSSSAAPATGVGTQVHLSLLTSDGATYGVGEPIVVRVSARIPNGDAFAKAATVKVNGTVVEGAWHFENTGIDTTPIEGHFRANPVAGATTPYWPAHATISMDLDTKGLATAPSSGQYFDDSLTLNFKTGAANISTVDCAGETLTPTQDGTQVHPSMPTSCGKAGTPTYEGVKVVMQKGEDDASGKLRPNGTVLMTGTGYSGVPIKWSVRINATGEYVHDLNTNPAIGRSNSSHGCTNLKTADAAWFYNWAQLGDVLIYANTGGGTMPSWDGFGDWNLPQSEFNNETPDS